MSNIYFTFASLYVPNEVRESNKAGIHLSHGRASERNGSIPLVTSRTNWHCQTSFKTVMQSSL